MTGIGAKALQTRWFVRSPIPLFRAGLGFVFGGRLLLLQHLGRTSGQPRYVALETVERPATDRIIIASGFGAKAQWYRNLQADPHCRVWIGFDRNRAAIARTLTREESAAVLSRYRREHPKAYAQLASVIEEATELSIDDIPYVELHLS
ncbi:nitroreductase family deazaflavin-dependent oxidoreductase [Gordonia hydrophobica]|uniref:Nitroreductase family deazaflavin-dependent oxidoreductase n=1 Tax=Gordonia hydrophobica TaxID=40516 RepID=A0ABZ2TY58_9ACTN|nr:nitroreductase family deazaflavin-dependent oxidoreductase [Gordonia hydrophobica]MBM7366523.1 deazaflavin-dependent oxidoreductase (nitroreductase family) [Gordonia hydrophobica]